MKTYTNSKGEYLPKVICAVVDFEKARLKDTDSRISLVSTLVWNKSNIFGQDSQGNYNKWDSIYKGNYEDFYIVFPTCKNSRGQELPEDIQVEIVEERLRQWGEDLGQTTFVYKFNPYKSLKDSDYWYSVVISDYTPTELPTKSDDTFTQGEIVEVRNYENEDWEERAYVSSFKDFYITYLDYRNSIAKWKYIRKKPPVLELTLPELLTIAEEVKRTKVKLKS